jgi:hypothetical protein
MASNYQGPHQGAQQGAQQGAHQGAHQGTHQGAHQGPPLGPLQGPQQVRQIGPQRWAVVNNPQQPYPPRSLNMAAMNSGGLPQNYPRGPHYPWTYNNNNNNNNNNQVFVVVIILIRIISWNDCFCS